MHAPSIQYFAVSNDVSSSRLPIPEKMEVMGPENQTPIANEVRLFGYGVFGSTDSNSESSNFFDGSGDDTVFWNPMPTIRKFGLELLETFPLDLESVPISPPSDADLPEKDRQEEDHHEEAPWKSSAKSKPVPIPNKPRPEWPNTRGLPVAAAQLGLEVVAVYTDEAKKIDDGGSTEASGSGSGGKQVKFDPDMSPIGEAYRYTLLKQWHH
ncbi:hypothetical protein B9Z55_027251 [Caenorhabditis nigoni]|uniref:Uncharacterized protein n=1 Tax=Caenorhabditis nigoni TaxID=1611254 RepID=A0A2G5SHB1_9PELO|nr:hypothetical protein B9Z55_027251 [Caenorhabditis nigoni]